VIGFGISFDIETQKQIYILDPNHGRLERNSIVAIIVYFLTAAILFAFSRSYVLFAIALTIFHFSGIAFWRILSHQMMPPIVDSTDSAVLRRDHFALERLRLVREYMSGSWHVPRHAILSMIVLVFDFVAIPNRGEAYFGRFSNRTMAGSNCPGYQISSAISCVWLFCLNRRRMDYGEAV
jgi:hypothetical protein